MLTITEFLTSLRREANITTHLVSKLDAGHLDHRLTAAQRSLGELLDVLVIQLEGSVDYFLTGTWDRWEKLAADIKGLTPSAFPAAMAKQIAAIESRLSGLSDADVATRLVKSPTGDEMPLGTALLEFTLKFAVAYKMQLFLQAKHAGLCDLASFNLWRGQDPEPKAAAAAN